MSSSKYDKLNSLREQEFREEVLIPLLQRMKDYKKVRLRHGSDEYGKDITFCINTPLDIVYYAVVAKVGDISGAASGKQNLATIQNQIDMAFRMPIEDATEKEPKHVNKVIVWTTGKISGNAEKQILNARSLEYKNVEFKDGNITIDLLDEHFPEYFSDISPFVSIYFTSVKNEYSRLEELYALGGGADKHKLPTIFVAPSFELYFKRDMKQNNYVPPKTITFEELVSGTKNTLIVGGWGSGKSTCLRRMLLTIVEDNEKALQSYPIPILVKCKSLDLSDPEAIDRAVIAEFSRLACPPNGTSMSLDLNNCPTVILLDGLDELETEEKYQAALDLVRGFSTRRNNSRVIITSRKIRLFDEPAFTTGFETLEIRKLDKNQVRQFIENWHGKGSKTTTRLLNLFEDPIAYFRIDATPLTLALISVLYENGQKELPANLTELFDKYVELALGRWDAVKEISTQFQWKIKQLIIQKLAWNLHADHEYSVAIEKIYEFVDYISKDRGLEIDIDIFRREVIERSGLFILDEKGEYEFKHRSLQEYFAGKELSFREDATEIAVNNFLDTWWSWCIFFACGSEPSEEEYLSAILQNVSPTTSEYFNYALHLGIVAQATYFVNQDLKVEAIDKALGAFIEGWNFLTESDLVKWWDHIHFLDAYSHFVRFALGSITLSPAITALANKNIADASVSNDSRTLDSLKREWKLFFLAMICIRAENIKSFIDILKSDLIKNPAFLFLLRYEAASILQRDWIDKGERNSVDEIVKKLKRSTSRKSRNGQYIYRLFKLPPLPLLPPETDYNKAETPDITQ